MMAQFSNMGQNRGQSNSQQQVVEEEPDTTPIWQGMNVKLDLGNTIYTLATTRAKRQQYEIALNCNLKNKFYPTLELGYGLSQDIAGGGNYDGQGGFMKLGVDLNPLRKGRNKYYALLAGIRIGLGLQQFSLTDVTLNDGYWEPGGVVMDFTSTFRADCWGEICFGLQIQVVGPLTMGWYGRIHFLFTGKTGDHQPYYIPGYGGVDAGNFSFNYYIGYRIDWPEDWAARRAEKKAAKAEKKAAEEKALLPENEHPDAAAAAPDAQRNELQN